MVHQSRTYYPSLYSRFNTTLETASDGHFKLAMYYAQATTTYYSISSLLFSSKSRPYTSTHPSPSSSHPSYPLLPFHTTHKYQARGGSPKGTYLTPNNLLLLTSPSSPFCTNHTCCPNPISSSSTGTNIRPGLLS